MIPIETVLLHAIAEEGDRYVLGAVALASEPDPEEFDCAELAVWSCGRAAVDSGPARLLARAVRALPAARDRDQRRRGHQDPRRAPVHRQGRSGTGGRATTSPSRWATGRRWRLEERSGASGPGPQQAWLDQRREDLEERHRRSPPFPVPPAEPPSVPHMVYRYPSGTGVVLVPSPQWQISVGPCLLGIAPTGQLYAMGPTDLATSSSRRSSPRGTSVCSSTARCGTNPRGTARPSNFLAPR